MLTPKGAPVQQASSHRVAKLCKFGHVLSLKLFVLVAGKRLKPQSQTRVLAAALTGTGPVTQLLCVARCTY